MLAAQTLPPYLASLGEAERRVLAVALAASRRRAAGYARYADNPVAFIREVLGDYVWSKQVEICEAVAKYPRVAVKSCHSSGKSFIAGRIPCWWVATRPVESSFVVTSAPTFPQVRAILWRELRRAHRRGGLPGYTNQTEWQIGDELVAFGRKPDDADPAAFQGIHAENLLVVLDEAGGIPKALWDAAESLASNEAAKILAIGNPDDPNTEFGAVCRPGSGWHIITVSAFDTPNMTDEVVPDQLRAVLVSRRWVEERARRWGVDSPLYQSKVLGEFPDVSEDSLLAPRWVQAAVDRTCDPHGPVELGVDVARFGRNESVIVRRQGRVARLYKVMRKRDLMELVGWIVVAVRETGASRVKIDDAGMGGGVTDRLREIKAEPGSPLAGVEVVPINVGMAPTTEDASVRFVRLRDELCWNLRSVFEEGAIDLDDDLDLQAQLCAIKYKVDSRGRVQVESKDDMEKRLKEVGGVTGESGSPDRFDALMLAYAEPAPIALDSLWSPEDLAA